LHKKHQILTLSSEKESINTCWIHSILWFLTNWPNFISDLSNLCQNIQEDNPLQLISDVLQEWPSIRDLTLFNTIREIIFGSDTDTQEDAHEFLTKLLSEAQQYQAEIFDINFTILQRPANESHRENMWILGSDRIEELDIHEELQSQAVSGAEGSDGTSYTFVCHNLNKHVLVRTSRYFNQIQKYREFDFCDPMTGNTSRYRLLSAITYESYDDCQSGHFMTILLQNGNFFLCNNRQKKQIDSISAFDFVENYGYVFIFTKIG
jgi:hypothetical protein